MSEISALPSNIVEWLKSREELKGIKFLVEYPAIKKAVPLKNTIVAVGVEGMDIVDSFTENDEGVLEKNEYCRQANIKLKLSVHVPYSQGGEACHRAFTDIIDCLTFASGLDILSSGCEGIVSDRDTDAFVLNAWIAVKASLCPAETSSLDFPSFISKELLCASHINNADIHLTQTQKEYLESPFVFGTYFGKGESSKSISLGFKPTAVFVIANGMPIIFDESSQSTSGAYAGIAFRAGSTFGVELTNTGFKVKTGDSNAAGNCCPRLNELGTTYVYIAFKQ